MGRRRNTITEEQIPTGFQDTSSLPRTTIPTPAEIPALVPARGRICGDCGINPSRDQRAHIQDSRCLRCVRRIANAARKRRAQKAKANADQTTGPLHQMQAPTQRDRAV